MPLLKNMATLGQICSQETFEKLAVIRHYEVKKLMHDHVVAKTPLLREQLCAEGQPYR
jgi:hypothetical protein